MIAARILPDTLTLDEAARIAVSTRLHLVITRRGQVVCTPVIYPGMVKIAVAIEKAAA